MIQKGLKESMRVLRAYNDDPVVMKAIKSLDLRYKDVKEVMKNMLHSATNEISPTVGMDRSHSEEILSKQIGRDRKNPLFGFIGLGRMERSHSKLITSYLKETQHSC